MTKNLYRTERIKIEEGVEEQFILEYYLIQDKHAFKTGNINYICYGVEIRMREENNNQYSEIRSVEEIFFSKEIAIEFLDKLADGLVTPCTLQDIASDSLAESLA